jgi:antitoxin ChpS
MYTTNLKVGGSVMLMFSVILELLDLQSGASVGLEVIDGQLVVQPQKCTRYTLAELLAQCDETVELTKRVQWLAAKPVGRELF